MGKIFYLMGKSSSGKDTIYKRLMTNKNLALKNIVLYTTRPIRSGERDGEEYYFVSGQGLEELLRADKVIEKRTYHTCLGDWTYFTVDDENIDLSKQDYLMIGTIESFQKTKEYYGADRVIPIMIELDDGIRLSRALNREMAQSEPKYSEMCRRFLADEADFSKEKKQEAGITHCFVNDELETCLSQIEAYILSQKEKV